MVNLILLASSFALIVNDSITGDEDRQLRKEFRKRLDSVQNRILKLKSEGVSVAQAYSLVTTA